MAKSKYAPALFEVIQKRRQSSASGSLAVPKWWKSVWEPRATQAADSVEAAEEQLPAPVRAGSAPAGQPIPAIGEAPARPPASLKKPGAQGSVQAVAHLALAVGSSGGARAGGEPEPACAVAPPEPGLGPPGEGPSDKGPVDEVHAGRPPLLRMNEGRVVLSLNLVSVAVVVSVLALAMLTSFELGRIVGRPAAASPQAKAAPGSLEEALRQPPDAEVLNVGGPPALQANRPETERKPASPRREPTAGQASGLPSPGTLAGASEPPIAGLNYVILETFAPDHRNSAEHAQKWLASQHGIRTKLERAGTKWRLVSAEGFRDKAEYEPYCEKILSLGEALKRELRQEGLPVYRLASPLVEKLE